MTLEELSKDEQRQADEQNEMTYKAAVIEANRLKSQERMDIDRPRMNAAINKLIVAARFRIKRKPVKNKEGGVECPDCGETVDTYIYPDLFCSACGQAIDWSDNE